MLHATSVAYLPSPPSAGYPGGVFDPLGLASGSAESLADWKLKEIKNARLAMMAFLGFIAQHAATGKGPIDNLFDVSVCFLASLERIWLSQCSRSFMRICLT